MQAEASREVQFKILAVTVYMPDGTTRELKGEDIVDTVFGPGQLALMVRHADGTAERFCGLPYSLHLGPPPKIIPATVPIPSNVTKGMTRQ